MKFCIDPIMILFDAHSNKITNDKHRKYFNRQFCTNLSRIYYLVENNNLRTNYFNRLEANIDQEKLNYFFFCFLFFVFTSSSSNSFFSISKYLHRTPKIYIDRANCALPLNSSFGFSNIFC